jgi:hypothetical protein
MKRAAGKAAGGERVFIPSRGSRLADGGRARRHTGCGGAGECAHGAARPEGVIQRFLFNSARHKRVHEACVSQEPLR